MTLGFTDLSDLTGGHLGRFNVPCPECGPDRRSPSSRRKPTMGLWAEEPDFIRYYCARCGVKGWAKPDTGAPQPLRPGRLGRAFADAERRDRDLQAEKEARGKRAWAEFSFFCAKPPGGTIVETYLDRRGGLKPGLDTRFTEIGPRSYTDDLGAPAMIVAVRDVEGVLTGAQVTHLTPAGDKIRRLTFGAVAGGAVRLSEIRADRILAVGEGVETCRSFEALFSIPTWACLSATGLEQFIPPPGLARLVIAADRDLSGRGLEAARHLAERACKACAVDISLPDCPGDWNDALTARRAAA